MLICASNITERWNQAFMENRRKMQMEKCAKEKEREKKMKINLKKCFTPMTPPIHGTIVFGVHVIGFHVDRY